MSESPRVSLRPATDADLNVLYAVAADLDTWEERYPKPPRPLTRSRWEDQRARYEAAEDTVSLVVDVDGSAVGGISLHGIDRFAGHAEVGISLAAPARGRGIGPAAIRLLIEFAFVRQNLRRLHLEAIASNIAAIRAYEKAGFVIEGRQREHAYVRGRYEDIVRMGILRGDCAS